MKYNFKNIAFFATAILAIGAFSACSNEIENIDEPQKETKTITFTTTLNSETPVSRVNYEEVAVNGGIELKTTWEKNDVLYVGLAKNETNATIRPGDDGSGYVKATIDNNSISEDGKTATFTLTPDESWSDGATLNVFYGTTDKTSIYKAASQISINFVNLENKPTTSNDNLNYTLFKYDYMFATTIYKDGSITTPSLEQKISVIKFILKGLDSEAIIKKFELTSTENVFNASAYIRNSDNKFTYGNLQPKHYLHTTATQIAETNGEWDVYVAILPTHLTKDKEITINVVDNNSKTYSGTIVFPEIVVGKVYVTEEITMTKQQ